MEHTEKYTWFGIFTIAIGILSLIFSIFNIFFNDINIGFLWLPQPFSNEFYIPLLAFSTIAIFSGISIFLKNKMLYQLFSLLFIGLGLFGLRLIVFGIKLSFEIKTTIDFVLISIILMFISTVGLININTRSFKKFSDENTTFYKHFFGYSWVAVMNLMIYISISIFIIFGIYYL